MRAFLGLVITAVWCVVVFFATLWLTFPSRAVADRIAYEVPRLMGDEYSAEVGSVGPWWLGVHVADLSLHRADTVDGAPQDTLVALVKGARVALSPTSLLRRSPYLTGRLDSTDGSLSYEVGTGSTGKSGIALTDLVLRSDRVALGDLLALLPQVPVGVAGGVAVDVALHAGENGMKDASGRVHLDGADLTLSNVPLLGKDIPLSQLEITADVKDGKASVSEGKVASPLGNVEITGDVSLRDPLDRSSIDLDIVLSDLGSDLATFEPMLAGAKESDGKYHFHCRGIASRLNVNSCTMGTDSRSGRMSSRSLPTHGTDATSVGASDEGLDGEGAPRHEPMSDDERAKRREEIRERLRQKREERLAERQGTAVGTVTSEPTVPVEDPGIEEEPPMDDEEGDEVPMIDDLEEPQEGDLGDEDLGQ